MQKFVKKVLGCVLAVVMVGNLAACGDSENGGNPAGESLLQEEMPQEPDKEQQETEPESSEEILPEVDLTIGGEVTVSVYEAEEWLKIAAKNFMEQNPGTNVVIHDFKNGTLDLYSDSGVGDDSSRPTGQTREDYITQLNTQIMSGEAEDVILTSGGIPIERYMQMGVFEDLRPYLASATEITDEHYYMNIFEACRAKDGALYQFPLAAMATPLMAFDKELMENTGVTIPEGTVRMSLWDAMDLAKEMYEKSTLTNTFMSDGNIGNLFTKAAMDGMNYKTGTVELDRDRILKLLALLKDLQDNYEMTPEGFDFYSNESHYPFMFTYGVDIEWASNMTLHADEFTYVGYQCEYDDGKVYLCPYYALDFGMNSASENKGTAWAFMKYLVSEEIQTLPSLYWSGVNKAGLYARVEGSLRQSNSSVTKEEIDAVVAQLESWILQIDAYRQEDSELIVLTESVLENFRNGSMTAEETLDDLESKLEQFMSE